MLYNNYLNNYIKKKYIFSNEDFSLRANKKHEIFLQIKNIDIFEIKYLIQITINNNIKEWVCNPYYGLYLLYKIKKCQKPYSFYPEVNHGKYEDINKIKTICNMDDFDSAISKGVKEIEDLNYEVNLDEIIKKTKLLLNIDLLKGYSPYRKYLNLNELAYEKADFGFLKSLFGKENFLEEYIYIFGSKNYLNTEDILDNLIYSYKANNFKFLYLDLDYISQLKYKKDLKNYLAFWLIRAFSYNDYEKYKSFFNDIINLIDFSCIPYIIKKLIEYNEKNYKRQKLFFILNNANTEKAHEIINNIKTNIEGDLFQHFIIICNIENEFNFNKFIEIYKKQEVKLILIPDLLFNEPIINAEKEINEFFGDYSLNKFIDLIKIFHFSSFMNYKSEEKEDDFSEIDLIKKYKKYFKLDVKNNLDEVKPIINNIKFRNKDIEKIFLQQYENYLLHFIESDKKLQEVLNLNDGDFFEKLIILDFITNKILNNKDNNNFIKLEVNSLFGFNLKNIDLKNYKEKNIIFTQKSKTAEIFDFGILINKNNQLIMKLYQVSTKKSKDDLSKLDLDIIKLHCINIKKNLEILGNINSFSFGIITSYRCYEKKKDFNLMKDDCTNKNYELLIYNIIERQFYFEQKDDKDATKNILLPLDNIFSIKNINKLELPNYDSLFKLKPKLISMKYLNQNYINCLRQYFENEKECTTDIKIIGKIKYNSSYINSSINDKNLGILISGNMIEKNYTTKTKLSKENEQADSKNQIKNIEIPKIKNDIEIKIMKDSKNNKIYRKDLGCDEPKVINEIKMNQLFNPHILLYKFDEEKFIGKKRNPNSLFTDEIVVRKRKKY